MKQRKFGNHDVMVPVIGEGTWQMENDDRAAAIAAIRAAIDAGLTHIDTAELYGYGEVEKLVGEAIAGHRDRLYLVSKVMPSNASGQGTVEACETSLRWLGTDYLDCYLLHWPGQVPIEETIAAFEALREQGKIRSWGVSNFDADELDEVIRIAGPGVVACNQVLYHLGERTIEHELIGRCEAHGVAVVAYSPYGSGDFPDPGSPGGALLSQIGATHGASARQVALAFLTRRESVLTIPKSSRVEHVLDNAAAGDLTLTPEEISQIDAAFPLGPKRPGIPYL